MVKKRSKTRYITLQAEEGVFSILFKKFKGEKDSYNFSDLSILRRLLSNEKARILHTIKTKNPQSIYSLAKLLERDFKSVIGDIKLLEAIGFIELIAERKGKRQRHKPVLVVDELIMSFSI